MRKIIYLLSGLFLLSCAELDLNPPSSASSENWYADKNEYEISINDFYREYLWELDINWTGERMTDNWSQRQVMHSYSSAGINSEWGVSRDFWKNTYKGIARANTILENIKQNRGGLSEADQLYFEAEARFFRAVFYGRLLFYYGDVPFFKKPLTIEEAFKEGRTQKSIIKQEVYQDFNFAIAHLPLRYDGTQTARATKGAALAFKARTALNLLDFETAKIAAKECMNMDVYELHPDYEEYFLSRTRNSKETIFAIPRSVSLNATLSVKNFVTRNSGGSAVAQPSWDLLASYLCTDGKTIDQSPLFDPKDPFKNRDPRLAATIVEFEKPFLGYHYSPRPDADRVLHTASGKLVKNKDTRSVDTYASYNGLALKKGVDEEWIDDFLTDADIVLMRYAEVLLMFAEAKIGLGEIDSEVADALYELRNRAYRNSGIVAPAIELGSVSEMKRLLQMERRVELAWENRRIEDLIRWRLAEYALNRPNYGLLDPEPLQSIIIDQGLWFWSEAPKIDANGLPIFDRLAEKGYIKKLADRTFDSKQYLWPIPSKEIIINPNIKQNPGY